MAQGLLLQGSYSWSHATSNQFANGVGGAFTTLRNYSLDRGPSPYDIRHAVKLNWIYELPFGPKRHFLSDFKNAFTRKALEGWSLASVIRLQTGSPIRLLSGRATFNSAEAGVIMNNITAIASRMSPGWESCKRPWPRIPRIGTNAVGIRGQCFLTGIIPVSESQKCIDTRCQ